MTSPAGPGAPRAARTAQRVEIFVTLSDGTGQPRTLPGGPGGVPRVPGAVLGHGEHPREAVRRAVSALPPALSPAVTGVAGGPEPGLVRVLSDVRRRPDGANLHVIRLVYGAGGSDPEVNESLLRDPSPAPGDPGHPGDPGSPPRVQRPGAYAVVVLDGHVLLTRFAGTGSWTLPGGGIDHGEHPDDAVRREAFEEAGVQLSALGLVAADSRHFTGTNPHLGVLEDFHGVRLIYRAEVAARTEPVVQEVGGSTDAAAWVPLAELSRWRTNELVRTGLALVGIG